LNRSPPPPSYLLPSQRERRLFARHAVVRISALFFPITSPLLGTRFVSELDSFQPPFPPLSLNELPPPPPSIFSLTNRALFPRGGKRRCAPPPSRGSGQFDSPFRCELPKSPEVFSGAWRSRRMDTFFPPPPLSFLPISLLS